MKIVKAGQYVLSNGEVIRGEVEIRFTTDNGYVIGFTPRAIAPLLLLARLDSVEANLDFFLPHLERLVENIPEDGAYSQTPYVHESVNLNIEWTVTCVRSGETTQLHLETAGSWESEQSSSSFVNLYNEDIVLDPARFTDVGTITLNGDIEGEVRYCIVTKQGWEAGQLLAVDDSDEYSPPIFVRVFKVKRALSKEEILERFPELASGNAPLFAKNLADSDVVEEVSARRFSESVDVRSGISPMGEWTKTV